MKKFAVVMTGFLVAPLIAAVITAALAPIGGGEDFIAWGLIPIFYLFAFFATLFFGMPAFFLLSRFNLITWWSSVIVGVVIGGLAGIILRLPSTPHLHDFTAMMPVGAASALSFWLIWRLAR